MTVSPGVRAHTFAIPGRLRRGSVAAGCYLGAVVGANWASTHNLLVVAGVVIPLGACAAGVAFTARDALDDALGTCWVVAAIAAGTVMSAVVASPRFAAASAAAFVLSEFADSWLYRRLRPRGWMRAVAGSNLGGLVVDSVVFVPWAFGSLALLPGQLVGKVLSTVVAVAILAVCWRVRP